MLFSLAFSLVLFLPSWLLLYIDFVAFSFSMLPTVGGVQHSTPQNKYVAAEDLLPNQQKSPKSLLIQDSKQDLVVSMLRKNFSDQKLRHH